MSPKQNKQQAEKQQKIFSGGVRGAIPGANLQLEILNRLIREWRPRPERMLDLGCGDGSLGQMLLNEYPASQVIFAYYAQPMMENLSRILEKNDQASVIKADFASPTWIQDDALGGNFDVIVSGYAIHHHADERKKTLYAEIHGLLKDGGLFLNLDQVSSPTPKITAIFDNFFLDHIRRFVSEAGQEEKISAVEAAYFQDKKESFPAAVDEQCLWLREVGFQEVDCFFKTFEIALFGGRKAATRDAVNPES